MAKMQSTKATKHEIRLKLLERQFEFLEKRASELGLKSKAELLKWYIVNDMIKAEAIFDAIFERESDGRYYGYCPSLPGCRTWGHDVDETLKYMQDAVELYIEDLIADGKPVPGIGIVKSLRPVVRIKAIKEAVHESQTKEC